MDDRWAKEIARNNAGRKARQAIKSGKLPSPKTLPCADCGGPATEYDHRDYTKPLEVAPVCRLCNRRRPKPVYPNLDEVRARYAAWFLKFYGYPFKL